MIAAKPNLPWHAFRRKTLFWILFWVSLPYSLVVLGVLRLCRDPRLRLRTILVGATLAALVVGYAASYYQLSRRGMQEANRMGLSGFLYVPFSEAAASQDLTKHRRHAVIYAPLNALDQAWFKSKGPVQGIMWRLAPAGS